MPPSDTREMTAQVPTPLAERVDELAARLDRSRGWVVEQALAAYVNRESERYRMTLEAMADVDAGLGVTHHEVKMWAASLCTESPKPLPE